MENNYFKIFQSSFLIYYSIFLSIFGLYSDVSALKANCLGDFCNSDPSLVSNLQVSQGCSKSNPCIDLKWNNPQQFKKSDFDRYKVKYRVVWPKSRETGFTEIDTDDTFCRIEIHKKPNHGATFEFHVSKFYKEKFGKPIIQNITLGEDAPSDSPKNVTVTELDSTSAKVTWDPPIPIYQNGKITVYQLRYFVFGSEESTETFVNATNTNAILTGLIKSHYIIFIRAFTKVGPGPWSNPNKHFRFLIRVPLDSPKNLQIKDIDSRSIQISWSAPDVAFISNDNMHYELRYYAVDLEESSEKIIVVNTTKAVLADLTHLQYKVFVRAVSNFGPGIWSNPITVYSQITQDLPVPINVEAFRSSSTDMIVKWTLPKPSEKNKASPHLGGFLVMYSQIEKYSTWVKHTLQREEYVTTIKRLDPNTKYQVKVASTNPLGDHGNFSETIEEIQKTLPQFNLKTVRIIRCSVQNSRMLKVEWQSPSITTDLQKFEVIYSGSLSYISSMGLKKSEYIDKKTQTLSFEHEVTVYNIKLEDLQPNANYSIEVQAFYNKRDSVKPTLEKTCSTLPSVPDSVLPPTIIGLHEQKEMVKIRLHRCSEKNGPISNYSVIVGVYQRSESDKPALSKYPESYTFMELSVNTKMNDDYIGEYIALSKDVNYIFQKTGDSFSDVILGDDHEEYDMKLLAFNKKLKPNYNYKCFVRVCLQGPSSLMCKSSNWSKPFMIKQMTKDSNGSILMNIDKMKDDNSGRNSSVMIMIFLVFGVLLASTSIVVGCVIKRKKSKERFMNLDGGDEVRSSIMMKSSMLNGIGSHDKLVQSSELEISRNNSKKYKAISLKATAPDLVTADSVLMCQDGSKLSPSLVSDSKKMRINSHKLDNATDRPPIPICNLFQYVTDLKANDCAYLQTEFETLNTNLDDRFSWQRSNIDSNKSKNRYANVVAYDHTSVLLSPLEDVMGSDYINANYIDGYQKQNAYIATQGPLPDTTDDFWRMVWEQRSSCIVMMTRLEERSGVKCHQYWPNRGFICYGQMTVSHLDTFFLSYYTIRIFELRHNKYAEKREIQHFQFTAWPDHGVPKLNTPLLMFIRRVRSIGKIESGPKIVHCSAGVGRTGAFIVVDAQLERIKQEKTVDVFNYVSKIRCQRNYMVQTQAQYQFILETLLEAVEDGNTEVLACNFHPHVTKLSQIGISGSNQLSGFEMEFSKLNSLASNRGRHGVMLADFVKAAGNQTVNLTKNRVRNIIPYDWNRVVLNAIRGIDGSDYINASYIDGYRDRKAYIAAQSPIPSTVEDFWRMIWDQHCGVVIVLNQSHEDKSHVYWPVNKSIRYQFFVVDPVVEYNMPNYILREFKVTDARDGEFRALRQFQFTQWPSHGCPKESDSILDFIRQVHKTKEQFGHMEPMVIHCSTGSGRTGVFIALSVVLDRLQQESVVDMYQTVKLLHKQRIGLVQTEEQYEFCYMAVLDYLSNYEKMIDKSEIY